MRIAEYIGFLASALTVVSFAVKGETRIRLVNTCACIAFIIYALMINAPSVLIANGAVLLINAARIYRLTKAK